MAKMKCEQCSKIEEVAEEYKDNILCKECYKKQKNGKVEDKELVNQQTKVNIEISISRNYNKVMFSIQDEPIGSTTEKEFREGLKLKAKILREEAEEQLKLIGSKPIGF